MFGKKGGKPASIQTLIGGDTRIEGDLRFEGGCHIDGMVNGSVTGAQDSDAYLSVSEHGCVQGNVVVPRLGLSGKVEGDVYVSDRAELGPTARVNGNVHYNLIELAASAEINGQLLHEARPVSSPPTGRSTTATEQLTDADLAVAAKQSG